MRLVIARHGETVANNDDRLQGQQDCELSERGYRQAEALAAALCREKIDAIYCSDLKRARVTAECIGRHHDVPVKPSPEARERHFGIFAGTIRTEFYSRERALPDPYQNRPEGGESFQDLFARARQFLETLYSCHTHESVLLVAHGDFARMCLGNLMGKKVSEACQIRQTNGCINVLEVGDGLRSRILCLDSTEHLPPELMSHNLSAL